MKGNRDVVSSGFQPEECTFPHRYACIDTIKCGVLFQEASANVMFFYLGESGTLYALVPQVGLEQKHS